MNASIQKELCSVYAEDIVLYRVINSAEDCDRLQHDLNVYTSGLQLGGYHSMPQNVTM